MMERDGGEGGSADLGARLAHAGSRREFLKWSGAAAALALAACRDDEPMGPHGVRRSAATLTAAVVTKTVKPSGGDFTSLAAAINGLKGTYGDLVARDEILRIECYAMEDTATVMVAEDWVTDADHYIHIVVPPSERHRGTWDAGKYRLAPTNSFWAMDVRTPGVRIEGLQIENRSTSTSGASGIRFANDVDAHIESCIIRRAAPVAVSTNRGIALTANGGTLRVRNCIVYNYQHNLGWTAMPTGATLVAYNNTFYGSGGSNLMVAGSGSAAVTLRLKNNLCANRQAGSDYSLSVGSITGDYAKNLSSDGSAPGADAIRNATVAFVNAAAENFHLASGDTAARDAGADLSADATWPFATDIDGQPRTGPWEVGADAIVGSALVNPATLPQATVDTTYVPGATTVTVGDTGDPVQNGANLQAAIDAAARDTDIVLTAGGVYRGNFVLPGKPGTAFINIRSSALSSLPAGQRVTPAAAAHLPRLESTNNLATVRTIRGTANASYYRLVGLEIAKAYFGVGSDSDGIVAFGTHRDSNGVPWQDTLAKCPTHLIIDRCWVHGTVGNSAATSTILHRGVSLHCKSGAVVDSSLLDIAHNGIDCQAIYGANGPGPYLIRNNRIEGSTENILFGGADPDIDGLNPADITIARNHIIKPESWNANAPSYTGYSVTIKNLLELKVGVRVLIEGNVFEGCWPKGQDGTAVLFKTVNQSGGHAEALVQDVTFRYNVVRKATEFLRMIGREGTVSPIGCTNRVHVHDNLVDEIDVGYYTTGGTTQGVSIAGGCENVAIEHNTICDRSPTITVYLGETIPGAPNLRLTDNIYYRGASYGVRGTGQPEGTASINAYAPSVAPGQTLVTKNIMANSSNRDSTYPPGNLWATNEAAVGFTDVAAKNYRLTPASMGYGAGTDGRDIGADIDAVEAATAGVA